MRGAINELARTVAVGFLAAAAMVLLMLVLRHVAGVPTIFELIGDRVAPLIPAAAFSMLISWAGGYNELKTFLVFSGLGGQVAAATLGGSLFLAFVRRARRTGTSGRLTPRQLVAIVAGLAIGVWLVIVVALFPNLVTNYAGRPATEALILNAVGLALELGLFASIVGGAALGAAHFGVAAPGDDDAETPSHLFAGRRSALLAGGATVLLTLAASGGLLARLLGRATFGYDGRTVEGPHISPITPNDRFYVVTKNIVDPVVDPGLWRLEIDGNVARPARYSLSDLRRLEHVEQESTLMCISNGVGGGLMSNAFWTGVQLADLLEDARPAADAVEIIAYGVDGYTDTIELATAMENTTLLVLGMNGEPLPQRHGAPVRLIVPGLVGEKQVKWLTRIEVVDRDVKGFYESQGWGPDFRVPARSRIDFPRANTPLRVGGTVAVAGIAYGGDRGVGSAEVSTDGGSTWLKATLTYSGTRLTWALWRLAWTPRRVGEHELVVRMIDGDGRRQIEEYRPIVAQGALGLHRVRVQVGG